MHTFEQFLVSGAPSGYQIIELFNVALRACCNNFLAVIQKRGYQLHVPTTSIVRQQSSHSKLLLEPLYTAVINIQNTSRKPLVLIPYAWILAK